jgi:polar amino acid transport system substrate-binding protein
MNLKPAPEVIRQFTPHGPLRAAINLGNSVLVQKDQATGDLQGVTPALARELSRRLGTSLELIEYCGAGKVADAAGQDAWDICFLAIDPARAAQIDFTAPYVVIEGTYVVPDSSPLREIADVDRAGVRIAIGEKSAYDLYLTRTLKKAELVRAVGTSGAFDIFVRNGYEAIAGVRQPLAKLVATHKGFRMMSGRFTDIRQAMGVPKGRDDAVRYLRAFIEEMKACGFVTRALAESGQEEAQVALPEAVN